MSAKLLQQLAGAAAATPIFGKAGRCRPAVANCNVAAAQHSTAKLDRNDLVSLAAVQLCSADPATPAPLQTAVGGEQN